MTATRHLVPVLQGVTVAALAAAASLLLWPPDVQVAPADPVLPALVALPPVVASPAAALSDSIVNANIFSVTREAPDDRTVAVTPGDAPVLEVTSGEYDADAGIADSSGTASADAAPVPALYGVVHGPMGRAALLRLDPGITGARLFRLGEGAGGYRLRSIGADRVELSGPTGAIVLELVAKGGTP
ncbi:MAG: hypothetical protein V4813_08115 [Gemmatimonadota bacterium]